MTSHRRSDAPSDSDDDILRDLYRYDARAHTWSRCRDAPHGRCWHSATVVGGSVSGNSNVILVFGGETLKPNAPVRQPMSSMLSYDPEFDIFYDAVDRGHRPSARLGHTASLHTVCRSGLQMALEGVCGRLRAPACACVRLRASACVCERLRASECV